jgi:sugar (pentulose or hexulose) kinase
MSVPAIVIFDVGKTNKKVFLFDEQYKLLQEESVHLQETTDEDGFPCEDVNALTNWVQKSFADILSRGDIDVRAVNFSAYGASFVHVDVKGSVAAPLYNYLKPYPEYLKKQFYKKYGNETKIGKETASPSLGSLNSGMQLYRLKYEQSGLFETIAFSFHLPQFLSYVLADFPASEITSLGCHTGLWDFRSNAYHRWVVKEGIDKKLAPILPSFSSIPTNFQKKEIEVGVGMHDSSAALIPYLLCFDESFILISTGTWCITLNPFNHSKLTSEELKQDCLCYLSYKGQHVKASRLFAGHEHEQETRRLAAHFNKAIDSYQFVEYDIALGNKMLKETGAPLQSFSQTDLDLFDTYEEAYHSLMTNIVRQQVKSTKLVLGTTATKKIFVDGGFGKNPIYMNLLAKAFPAMEVYGATIPQASALGAALAIHQHWNKDRIPSNLVTLKNFAASKVNHST